MPKRAAVMQDLSGLGHCSLSAAMAILPAQGIQCCSVPTCILSTQTDGYTEFSFCDLTKALDEYLSHWEALGERFDAVFTGYLGTAGQIEEARRLMRMKKENGLVLVDPVMGDDGALYSAVSKDMPEKMRHLVRHADVITPNLTEAYLLLGKDYHSADREQAMALAKDLSALGPEKVVISGIETENTVAMAGIDKGNPFYIEKPRIACSYPGSGDAFACVLLGQLLRGAVFLQAVEKAADFVCLCVEKSREIQAPRREGLVFEPFLKELLA